LVAEYAARQNRIKLLELKFQQHLAAVAGSRSTELFVYHWEEAEKVRKEILQQLAPWAAKPVAETSTAKLQQQYKAFFGDPKDPVFQAEIRRLIDHWQKGSKHGKRTAS